MATDLSTALKDYNLRLRTAGTPATVGTETGTGKQITKAKTTVRGYSQLQATKLDLTTGNTYVIKFQESAALGSGYADITGATMTITAVGRKYVYFQLSGDKPYVRHVLTCSGGSSSYDGDIYIGDDDDI